MPRPSWLLVLLWVCALAVAAPTGQPEGHELVMSNEAQLHQQDMRAMEDATVLVDLGEGMTKDDGCSKAYEKFKAEIDKMTTLKDKAAKEKEAADKKERESTALAKRCNDDHKEILDKATYKKDVANKKIEEAVKAKFAKMKKEVDDKVAADKKKSDDKVAQAKKKEEDSTKKATTCKAELKKTTEDLKAKYAKDKKDFETKKKAEMDQKLKVEVEDQVLKKVATNKKQMTEEFDKKFSGKVKDCDNEANKVKKKNDIDKEQMKEENKMAVEKAQKETPPEVEKDLTQTKDKLANLEKEHAIAKSDLVKSAANLKETKADLGTKYSKEQVKASDCLAREKNLEKQLSAEQMKAKTLQLKQMELESKLEQREQTIKGLQTGLDLANEKIKAQEEKIKVQGEQLEEARKTITEKTNKIKMIMSKMSAGEGALMAEIESTKKAFNNEKDQNVLIGGQLSKCRLDHKKTDSELGTTKIKLRETGQELFIAKRDVEKEKVKFDSLTMAHTTTTERYRDVSSKKELCEDRMKDAKIKHQGCEDAMKRVKVYSDDTINEQKMELARVRQELQNVKEKMASMEVSQEEKTKADQFAKAATEKAVAQAVETAQANSLAVKTNAQEAVDKAAEEAVRIANAQAQNSQANSGNTQ
jgi:hypothetical protein